MKAKLRDTEIYFDITGMQLAPLGDDFIERPVLFLLHGGPGGDHLRFKQHSLELQTVAQLVFIDHRGCGRSKITRQAEYTLENNIEDIEALRQHLGLDKICILGTSFGGMVAQGYAIRYPEHLQKLILVATAPSYRFMDSAKDRVQQDGSADQIEMCENLWNGTFKNHDHIIEFFTCMDSLYSNKARLEKKQEYSRSKTIWSHEALNEGFGGFLRTFDFIPDLRKIRCPTLVLAGKDDWICNPAESKTIADNIPNARLEIFEKSSHAIAVDEHDRYINTIQDFLVPVEKLDTEIL
jgi:proline iminopeptidase